MKKNQLDKWGQVSSKSTRRYKMYKWLFLVISLGISNIQGFALSNIIASTTNSIYCLNSDGTFRWSFAYSNNDISGAAIGNIDNTGYPEIFVGANKFYCLEHDGTLKWSYPITTGQCSPTIANIDNAGNPEVLIVDTSSALYCFNNDGTVKWSCGISGSGTHRSSVTVASVDGIGTPEILVAINSKVYCINSGGTIDWSYGITNNFHFCPGVAVADINLDGTPEIIVSGFDRIYCIQGNGNLKWSHLPMAGAEISQPAIADIDSDGRIEIVIHQYSQTVFPRYITAFEENAAGNGLDRDWMVQCWDKSGGSAAAPVICDIDGDGDKDVMWIGCTGGGGSTQTGLLYIMNGTNGGHPDNSGPPCYTNSNFASGTLYERGVAVADIDDDGHIEIVGIKCGDGAMGGVAVLGCNTWADGRDLFTSHLYHITEINDNLTIPVTEPNNWGSHNTWLTQLTTGGTSFGTPTIKWIYNTDMGWITHSIAIANLDTPLEVEENNLSPKASDLKVLYKNGRRVIVFTLSKSEEVCFHVFDIVGRKKETLNMGTMNAGTHEIPMESNNIKNGVYFIKAHLGNRVLNYKTIIL